MILSTPPVPAYPVELSYPDDVIEGQAAIFQCSGVVGDTGSVALTYLDDVTGTVMTLPSDVIDQESTDITAVDSCKFTHDVTYNLTLDMTFNATGFRCQSSPSLNTSEPTTVNVIPGELLHYKRYITHSFYISN